MVSFLKKKEALSLFFRRQRYRQPLKYFCRFCFSRPRKRFPLGATVLPPKPGRRAVCRRRRKTFYAQRMFLPTPQFSRRLFRMWSSCIFLCAVFSSICTPGRNRPRLKFLPSQKFGLGTASSKFSAENFASGVRFLTALAKILDNQCVV